MRDGILLSRAQSFPFRHNDLNHLEQRFKKCRSKGKRFICVESLYSTDGSQAPLNELVALARDNEAYLIVDEAHAVGVRGPQGKGLVAEHHVMKNVFAQVVTFGKALGGQGAAVLGSQQLKDFLINFATSFIYTTALPFHTLAMIKCSYETFPNLSQKRRHLRSLIHTFQKIYPSSSNSPIQPVLVAGNATVKRVATALAADGYDIRPLLSPTVQRGREQLRICLHAFNTEVEVQHLARRLSLYV